MSGLFQTKDISLEVKDIDNSSRRVIVALSKFGNIDSDGDVIVRGAFAKSIQERGPHSEGNRKIAALRYHDFEHEIGVWKNLEETHDHLIGTLQLGKSTKGSDALADYEDGVIREHSIGYNLVMDKTIVREDGFTELREVKLWEGSAVTFGANSETPVFHVGKGNKTEYLKKLEDQMDAISNALYNGQGTDDRFKQLAMNLKVIQSKYHSLINAKPPEVDPKALDNDEPKPENNYKKFLLNN